MKALVCGLGSIGKRHIENLEKLGFSCKDILIYRTGKGTPTFGNNFLKEHPQHSVYYDIKEAFSHKPDITFITNPTTFHIPLALTAAYHNSHLYIEKPISNTLEKIPELIEATEQRNLIAYVAYNLRYHPALQKIKELIHEKILGEIINVHAEMGERISDWHPWENHTFSYACRKELGGGAVLTQSHEIDYLYWLFGKPEWVFAGGGTVGDLVMDVENVASVLLKFPHFFATLSLDYYKRPRKRYLQITGTEGRLEWNDFEGELTHYPLNKEKICFGETFQDRNMMYLHQLEEFLNCVKHRKKPLINLYQGQDVLAIALAIKKSLAQNAVIHI